MKKQVHLPGKQNTTVTIIFKSSPANKLEGDIGDIVSL